MTAFLPLRELVEELGGQVSWDASARKATITRGTTTVAPWIGNGTALVNGVRTLVDAKDSKMVPFIEAGKTYMPVNFIGSSLRATVSWEAMTKTATITLKEG